MNNGLLEERRLGRMIEVHTGATFQDSRRAYAAELEKFEPAIRKTTDLFMRVTTKEAEFVATILFAYADLIRHGLDKPFETDVLDEVMEWKKRRKPPLERSEVASHIRNLAALGWLDVRPSPDLPLPQEELAEFAD
jgi:hypothetical protein